MRYHWLKLGSLPKSSDRETSYRLGMSANDPLSHDKSSSRKHKTNLNEKLRLKANPKSRSPLREEPGALLLLTLLYAIQGVPLGLSMGSMPFLLRSSMSYTAVGLFSLASYPYSFKLLWSPIVDSLYAQSFGRRKSWIVPMQLTSGISMVLGRSWLENRLYTGDALSLTLFFFWMVLLAATQDIAVDGWALTLLSKQHVSWAATCQSVGMNVGYFLSFTVFLALNDASFCNAYLRHTQSEVGLLTLSQYLLFWGWTYICVTIIIAFLVQENAEKQQVPPLGHAYTQLFSILRLPAVQSLALLLIFGRLGMLTVESAVALKLLEKGVSKEALAGLVLFEFPIELISAVVAGRLASSGGPLKVWLNGYRVRLFLAAMTTLVVYNFPTSSESHKEHLIGVAIVGAATSFTSTLMFTCLGSFFNKISDPTAGGMWLTLLNTIANVGIVVPKFFLFAAIDWLTVKDNNGNTIRDGFYLLSSLSIVGGVVIMTWLQRIVPELEALSILCWRVKDKDF